LYQYPKTKPIVTVRLLVFCCTTSTLARVLIPVFAVVFPLLRKLSSSLLEFIGTRYLVTLYKYRVNEEEVKESDRRVTQHHNIIMFLKANKRHWTFRLSHPTYFEST
jgi:hypothetical protein